MSAIVGWLLLVGGLVAAIVGLLAMPAEGGGQAIFVFGGLGAVILGAGALLLARMSAIEGRSPPSPTLLRGLASPTAAAPFAAKTSAPARSRRRARSTTGSTPDAGATTTPDKSERRPWLPQTAMGAAGRPSRHLGSAITWAIVGALYYITGASGSGSGLDLLVGALILATPVGIVAAIFSRVTTGRTWSWAVSVGIAGVSFLTGIFVGALAKGILLG